MPQPTNPSDAKKADAANYDAKAFRNVQRARKLLSAKGWETDPEAQFLLESANVFALLELAEAIRGSK